MSKAWITQERSRFHASILKNTLTRSEVGIPSNADKDSKSSVFLASSILEKLGSAKVVKKPAGQKLGANFEHICAEFINASFKKLSHLRPGSFLIEKGTEISQFDQYSHLDDLAILVKSNREIASAIGSDYLIHPDIIIAREPEKDTEINRLSKIVDEQTALLTSFRSENQTLKILHASISCKWTLRSDRAQNSRSEGLNLVRNRKGKLPHIAVITAEPLPTRIASIALGTGDLDCVYHFALYELRKALEEQDRDDALELFLTMVEGKRLRDISDLPLDLVI